MNIEDKENESDTEIQHIEGKCKHGYILACDIYFRKSKKDSSIEFIRCSSVYHLSNQWEEF